MWSPTTPELFFSTLDGRIMVVGYAVQGDSFLAQRPRVWSETRLRMRSVGPILDLHPDGKHFRGGSPGIESGQRPTIRPLDVSAGLFR
jgi:hypothetical protein